MAPAAMLLVNILLWLVIFGILYLIGLKLIALFKLAGDAVLIWQLVFLAVIVIALISLAANGFAGWRLIH